MSEEKIDLALLGARVLTLTAEVRDLQLRFSALEGRFAAMESRFSDGDPARGHRATWTSRKNGCPRCLR